MLKTLFDEFVHEVEAQVQKIRVFNVCLPAYQLIVFLSCALHRLYRVEGDRYSRLIFSSEYQPCVELHVQEQYKIMASHYHAWHLYAATDRPMLFCGDVKIPG